jgi:hypothetical protein
VQGVHEVCVLGRIVDSVVETVRREMEKSLFDSETSILQWDSSASELLAAVGRLSHEHR